MGGMAPVTPVAPVLIRHLSVSSKTKRIMRNSIKSWLKIGFKSMANEIVNLKVGSLAKLNKSNIVINV